MPSLYKRPEPAPHEKRHMEALRLIPSDREYFALRGISEGGRGWGEVLGYVREKTGRKGKINLGKVLGSLAENKLITGARGSYSLTTRGELLLKATDDIFFNGSPPARMKTVFKGKAYPVGPLTDHFKLGKSPRGLYDLVRIHQSQQKTGWASIPGLRLNPKWLSPFFRKSVLEASIPHDELEMDIGRPQIVLGARGQNLHFYEPKKASRSLLKLSEKDINSLELKRTYTREELSSFRQSLVSKGVGPELAARLSRPVDAVVLWRILKGSRFFTEIGRLHNISHSFVGRGGSRLMEQGLIERKPIGIRVRPEGRHVIDYLNEVNKIAGQEPLRKAAEPRPPKRVAARQGPPTMEDIEASLPPDILYLCDVDAYNYLKGGTHQKDAENAVSRLLRRVEGIPISSHDEFAKWFVNKVKKREKL